MKCWNPDCGLTNDLTASFCAHCTHPEIGFPPPLKFNDNLIVEKHLGKGNFGHVYQCRDNVLSRLVAVKHLTTVPSSDRFQSELQTIAKLNHPNVVQIYFAEPKRRFFVMEYVDGGTLEQRIQSDLDSLRRDFFAIAIGICEGLKAAHVRRICHRDIKSENILLSSDGTPKITDFGLAKFLTTTSQPNTQLGTPYYIAPEIWNDEVYDLTVDIYSLGVLFYRIWTGTFSFDASTIGGLGLKVLTGKYDPPEDRNPNTPELVCELIRRMITPKTERIQSVELVLSELQTTREQPLRLKAGERTIDDMQRLINSIYSYRNYRRSPLLLLAHLSTNISGLIGGLRHLDRNYGEKRLLYYLPRSFAWICAFLSHLNWELSDIIWFKYPGRCPYCNQQKCSCPQEQIRAKFEVNEELLRSIREGAHEKAPPPQSFSYYQSMFAEIYAERNQTAGLDNVCLHMYSELGEVYDALLKMRSLEELQEVDILHLEVADLIAWFMAILNLWDPSYDFEVAFHATFPGRCYLCKQSKCRCSDVEDEIRLASWRHFTG